MIFELVGSDVNENARKDRCSNEILSFPNKEIFSTVYAWAVGIGLFHKWLYRLHYTSKDLTVEFETEPWKVFQ